MIQLSRQPESGPAHPPSAWKSYWVLRRNGEVTPFDPEKIAVAMLKAFRAVEVITVTEAQSTRETVDRLTQEVCRSVTRKIAPGTSIYIEDIQDQVELALMRSELHKVARAYVLYREKRAAERAQEQKKEKSSRAHLAVQLPDGSAQRLEVRILQNQVADACCGVADVVPQLIMNEATRNVYDNMPLDALDDALIMGARTLIESDPGYSFVSARLLLCSIARKAFSALHEAPVSVRLGELPNHYPDYFSRYVRKAVEHQLLDRRLLDDFDLQAIGAALAAERDLQFTYLGLQTLYDRYLIHQDGVRIELPQAFFMRVAMGLALDEKDRTARAIEFYRLLSSFDFMSSTPTLFNSGTQRPQLSSCYLTTIGDDLSQIYEGIKENALLSKFSGGLGNDWTPVRAMGARIKGTNGKSQGVVPFLKVANDTAVAVNQGGKRQGAVCAYLETWHLDIEEFLDLRKNTGDDRRRTHDMNTANWIPDLFMKRVAKDQDWTLFSPDEVSDLHDLYGLPFEQRYQEYEALAAEGKIRGKKVSATRLWRRMLSMLFETGHPWITFKDPSNLRSPQQHEGVVHSSNLCTEITLNTSEKEIAVCNLGSINLVRHVGDDGELDRAKLARTITTAMRMLDNVIDYNYYSVDKARDSNLKHRPAGMGLMGFQDALYKMGIPYGSEEAVRFSDISMEAISYFVISASSDLAKERGCYTSFEGSLWSRGVLPIDSIKLLRQARGGYLRQDESRTLDWDALRERVKKAGMRNSNTMAIAPTATIANICGVSQSIDPAYKNLYVKSSLSGEFTALNEWMVKALKKEGLWNEAMVSDLKYYDGDLAQIKRVPKHLKQLFATAFEIDPNWLVECAARRQKWIDQGQSLNLYMAGSSGAKMDSMYKLAWVRGLKTTYYLRTLGATSVEKSTVDRASKALNGVSLDSPSSPAVCSLDDPECEACQ